MLIDPSQIPPGLSPDYYRLRDFEYAQPLYDLAFLLEVNALAAGEDVPKYRVFSLWRAAYRMDGYTTTIDRWLDDKLPDAALDHVPSSRIRQYLLQIRATGTLMELASTPREKSQQIMRLRAIRGLGASRIAELVRESGTPADVASTEEANSGTGATTSNTKEWQAAHVVPPLLRFLREVETQLGKECLWQIKGITNGIQPVRSPFCVTLYRGSLGVPLHELMVKSATAQTMFAVAEESSSYCVIEHQLGWAFHLYMGEETRPHPCRLTDLARKLDPLLRRKSPFIKSDLHLHTSWSDGNSDPSRMAAAIKKAGREYFAITDHSRSCKLQGGLTPVGWLRQAASLRMQKLACPVLHGIEVDILPDGTLDLPGGLLEGMDLVVGSVHGHWSSSSADNTLRLLNAIESGYVDVLGHPTSAVIGKPGVPDYVRPSAAVDWPSIFKHCARWKVALELNCFPSRLDLALPALRQAIAEGCWISLGSDAHARSHLGHLRFGEQIVAKLNTNRVLNRLSFEELRKWIADARSVRSSLPKTGGELFSLDSLSPSRSATRVACSVDYTPSLSPGSRVVGIDLTAGKGKPSGIALLDEFRVETASLVTDDQIVKYIQKHQPRFVSIDSPLGLPGGGTTINEDAGIVRIAERDLASIGISAYPALIDSMRDLTLRGIGLKRRIEALPNAPVVFESYPGAAQDILSIPRKQDSLDLLRDGLRQLGLTGPGLKTHSHDEMDAITSAIVGRYFETGEYEPMGVPAEAQLIVPKVRPLKFNPLPVICLAGRSGSGKSIVARYLAVFYGFRWIRTRDVIRTLLIDDIDAPPSTKMFDRPVHREAITEQDLRDFGVIVLEKYHQVPLRNKLLSMIKASAEPVVVDSVRDLVDVNPKELSDRAVCLWYVESSDSRMFQRLKERHGQTGKTPSMLNPIDQKSLILRETAACIIENNGTLEEIRWSIEDALFGFVSLNSSPSL